MLEFFRVMVGTPPEGYEWLEYVIASAAALLLFQFVTDLFRSFAKWFSKG